VFRFCAIPQVMAIATLDKCFNNGDVFTGVVKVRKGLAVKMIMESSTMAGVETWFHRFAVSIKSKIDPNDPSAERTAAACAVVFDLCKDNRPMVTRGPGFLPFAALTALPFAFLGKMNTKLVGGLALYVGTYFFGSLLGQGAKPSAMRKKIL